MDIDLSKIEGFEWDKGNIDKNLNKHAVKDKEGEEVFSNEPFVSKDVKNSQKEERFEALGKTNQGRLLFVSFTIRIVDQQLKIRIISCRDMNKKEEVKYYEEI